MTEDLAQIWREYRAESIGPDSRVLDLGSSDGYFTNWARSRGAKVYPFDARNGAPVGATSGYCTVKGEGLGTYVVPGEGDMHMIGLDLILQQLGPIDFLKCDIEGGEYFVFDNVDLSCVERLAIEFHAWTTPDSPVDGLGIRDEPMPSWAFERLTWKLRRTHTIELVGDPEAGGYLYGTRT